MADEPRKQEQRAPWTKIFTAFKVALDLKKLILAAGGILMMSLGWWVLSTVFYETRSCPQWKDYEQGATTDAEKKQRWEDFKGARKRWNLLHEMAGRHSGNRFEERFDAADIAGSYEELTYLEEFATSIRRQREALEVVANKDGSYSLTVDSQSFALGTDKDTKLIDELKGKKFVLPELVIQNEQEGLVMLGGTPLKVTAKFVELRDIRKSAMTEDKIRVVIQAYPAEKKEAAQRALQRMKDPRLGMPKAYGRLRALPWSEYRGPNPYLLVTGNIKHTGPEGDAATPWSRGRFFSWLLSDQIPVLLEPLVKFLAPVLYLFDEDAGGWNRFYLILVVLWTLFTWGLFGGAITRIAAVQVARNERVGLRDAFMFSRERLLSYFSAPVLPLIFLGVLSFFLIVLGFLEGWTFFLGDIFFPILFWPLIIIFGLVMAVVLVGLVGYPLMNPTISTEGSDSFDALSRSYSYVYQAPWQYLWYGFLSLVYGAVLVFFVGFMGSLMVYLAKWGVALAPFTGSADPAKDREPTYLFVNAPTTFGWRDLLLKSSRFAEPVDRVSPGGVPTVGYQMRKDYMDNMSWSNYVGAFFVSIWLHILILLIVGFGYSYFWTASSILYLLMRHHVDDTEIEEVHLEEDEGPEAFVPPEVTGTAVKPPTPPPAAGGVTMVDAPALRMPTLPLAPEQLPTPTEGGPPPEPKPPTDGAPPGGNP